jgi:porphobilinogen synthase
MTDETEPRTRTRRLRATPAARTLTRETQPRAADLVQPYFVASGTGVREPIDTLPGARHVSPDVLAKQVSQDRDLGLRAALLFGVPDTKDPEGRAAADPEGPVARALERLDDEFGDDHLLVADTCLCAYTTHGHCGVLDDEGRVDNDASLGRLAEAARVYARAGADWVAPSDMMDGRVAAIRSALDEAGFADTAILSYAAKYRSAFYGPFRGAQGSDPEGDRASYQLDPANAREGLRAVERDVEEGADAVLVKPGLPYLDVLYRVRERVDVPVGAYHVSGEHAMLEAAAEAGHLDRSRAVPEALTCLERAGADLVVTYQARRALQEGWI